MNPFKIFSTPPWKAEEFSECSHPDNTALEKMKWINEQPRTNSLVPKLIWHMLHFAPDKTAIVKPFNKFYFFLEPPHLSLSSLI